MPNEVLLYASNWGFAGLFCVLFWRFIRTTQKDQTQTLNHLANSIDNLADKLDRELE